MTVLVNSLKDMKDGTSAGAGVTYCLTSKTGMIEYTPPPHHPPHTRTHTHTYTPSTACYLLHQLKAISQGMFQNMIFMRVCV